MGETRRPLYYFMVKENSTLEFVAATLNDSAAVAREITDEVNAQLPQEKAKLAQQMAQTAKEVRGLESSHVDGRGQAIASIPPIAYHRWNLLLPGCWKDRAFVDEFLTDNRECLLPGYRPKSKAVVFDMAARGKISPGAKLYWQYKEAVNG